MSEILIQFGCWNNKNTENGKTVGGLQIVMEAIKKYARKQKPKFLIVSGDNYYPQKEKSKDGTTLGEMVYPDEFDPSPLIECSHGIHAFITREEAKSY